MNFSNRGPPAEVVQVSRSTTVGKHDFVSGILGLLSSISNLTDISDAKRLEKFTCTVVPVGNRQTEYYCRLVLQQTGTIRANSGYTIANTMGLCASVKADGGPRPIGQKVRRRVFQKYQRGLDDYEKIPDLNWDKFNAGVVEGEIALEIVQGTSASGQVYKVTDWGSRGRDFYRG